MSSPPNKVFVIDPKLYQRQALNVGGQMFGKMMAQQQSSAGPYAAAAKMEPLQVIGWQNIPSAILGTIAQHLPMEDRKSCTLVCRRWNNVIFASVMNKTVTFPVSKWQSDRYVLFSGFHPMVQRGYRNVEISWINYPDLQYLLAINSLFEALPKYGLQKLTINAPPDQTLGEFFERHLSRWNHIQELHVHIGSPFHQYPLPVDEATFDNRKLSINMPALKSLECVELSLSNISHGRQYFIISALQLIYAKVYTCRHWNCYTVLNIKSCPNLRNAILDIPSRIWRTFQCNSFEQLNTLNFTTELRSYAIENIAPVQFDQMFGTMKNLQAIKISGPVDDPLVAVCRWCPLIWSVELSRFTVAFDSFAKLAKLKKLKNLSLAYGKITDPKKKVHCESLRTLWLRDIELDGGACKVFPLQLNDAMMKRLIYTKREDTVICNYSTNTH